MTAETTPAGISTSGKLRVWFVPSGSNPLSVAILESATAKSITYSMPPDGFSPNSDQETIKDERLTNPQKLEAPGDTTETLEVTYLDGTPADTALAEAVDGFVVERRGVANATAATVGQKVRMWPITAGVKRPDAPASNGMFTTKQKLFVTGIVQKTVLVA